MDDQIIKYLSGELAPDKRLEFIQRVENEPVLKSEFICLQNLHALSQLSSYSENKDEGVKSFESFFRQTKNKRQKRAILNVLKYAAVVTAFVIISIWGTLYFSENNTDADLNTLYVPAGQRARITLQDGTEVWLNAQSSLKYPARFTKKNREIEIEGEAFFNVAKDSKRPFIVSTNNINLKVLGTQFNVYSYPDVGYMKTELLEGSVKIYKKNNEKNAIIIEPEEQLIVRGNEMYVGKIENSEHLLWKEGIYSFRNERLIDIIEKLQLYYDVKIIVEDPEIFNVKYTGKFRQLDGIDEILRIIQKIRPFNIKKDTNSNEITITK